MMTTHSKMKGIFYDCELAHPVTKAALRQPKNLVLGVCCTFVGETYSDWFDTQADMDELGLQFDSADILIGFNNIKFDNPILESAGLRFPKHVFIDLFLDIQAATGQMCGLSKICELNDMGGKSGSGADAPVQWQKGQRLEVISYCRDDVALARKLFWHIVQKGRILYPNYRTHTAQWTKLELFLRDHNGSSVSRIKPEELR